MDGLVCLICDIKYQFLRDCYLKLLYATILFFWG